MEYSMQQPDLTSYRRHNFNNLHGSSIIVRKVVTQASRFLGSLTGFPIVGQRVSLAVVRRPHASKLQGSITVTVLEQPQGCKMASQLLSCLINCEGVSSVVSQATPAVRWPHSCETLTIVRCPHNILSFNEFCLVFLGQNSDGSSLQTLRLHRHRHASSTSTSLEARASHGPGPSVTRSVGHRSVTHTLAGLCSIQPLQS